VKVAVLSGIYVMDVRI